MCKTRLPTGRRAVVDGEAGCRACLGYTREGARQAAERLLGWKSGLRGNRKALGKSCATERSGRRSVWNTG